MANASAAPIQDGRILKITTPLDPDYLLLQSIELVEEISGLPRAECVVLHDENSDVGFAPTLLDINGILGKIVSVRFETADGTCRHFNGMVNSCSQMDRRSRYTSYRLEIVPAIWLLTQNLESRIFQNVTIQEILEQILGEAFTVEYQLSSVEWKKRNYVVQYRESDFSFISRLMEEEGIFYYFAHTAEEHKMIVCVSPQSHQECPSKAEVPYHSNVEEGEFKSRIADLVIDYKLQPGKVTLWDYTFEKPKSNFAMTQPTRFKFGNNEQTEHYLFPAGSARKHDVIDAGGGERGEELQNISDDVKRTAEFMQQSIDSRHKVIRAQSNCCSFTAGHKFKLSTHPTKEMVGSYVITKVSHRAVQSPGYNASMPDGGYENSFECIPWGESSNGEKAVPFRPERLTPRPMILTAQTATVVGKKGEEIYTDKYGRVKVQFNWDREGERDEGSSCWARVAQQWAGNRWGAMFIPRVGMEVLVHFLEGDPDQPIITGCVYNHESMPPYGLPDEKTKSGIKSDSSKDGNGFNEWRFEDKKGEEQIFIHGQKDLDVRIKKDRREWIGNDRHLIVKRDKREKIERDVHSIVDRHVYESIGVKGGGDYHREVKGKIAYKTGGGVSHEIGGSLGEKVGGSHSEEAGQDIYIKAGMKVVIEAGMQITLKGPGGFVDIGPAGVTIQGTMVLINSGGAAGSGSPVGLVSPQAPEEALIADNADPGSKAPTYKTQIRNMPVYEFNTLNAPAHKPSSDDSDTEKVSWIEIKLLDEDNLPVPGERYVVTLPDGKVVASGTLDSEGFARVDNIDPGNCKVSFPNRDGRSWEKM